MKFLFATIAAAVLLAAGCTVTSVHHDDRRGTHRVSETHVEAGGGAAVSVEIDFFYDRLSPHGEWVEVADYGWCWYPNDVEVDWRPYSRGHWLYADDCGWYWHSDYEWSWAGHHYGRWVIVGSRWHWVPGYEWAGAWVVWRHGGGHVGWAPLHPDVHWDVSVGFRTTSYDSHIHESSWVFVAEVSFGSTSLHSAVLAPGRNRAIIGHSSMRGSASLSGGVIVNVAITHESAVKFTGKKIKHHRVKESRTLGAASVSGNEGEIRVFRPSVVKGKGHKSPRDSGGKDHKAANARKTMKEKHEAEEKELPKKHEKSGKSENDQKADREKMRNRQEREEKDLDNKHGKDPKRAESKPAKDNDKGKGKKPDKDDDKGNGKKSGKDDDKGNGKKSKDDPGNKGGKKK